MWIGGKERGKMYSEECFMMSSVAQSCLILWDGVNCSPLGSSVHGTFQAKLLEWLAISFSRGSSWPRDWTHLSCISCLGWWILYNWTIWEAPKNAYIYPKGIPGYFSLVSESWNSLSPLTQLQTLPKAEAILAEKKLHYHFYY